MSDKKIGSEVSFCSHAVMKSTVNESWPKSPRQDPPNANRVDTLKKQLTADHLLSVFMLLRVII